MSERIKKQLIFILTLLILEEEENRLRRLRRWLLYLCLKEYREVNLLFEPTGIWAFIIVNLALMLDI